MGVPLTLGGTEMSFNVAVADGLYNLAIFGVKGGVTHTAGQFDRPVSCASSEGNGSGTPTPFGGKLKTVWSVGASSCAVTAYTRSKTSPVTIILPADSKGVHQCCMRARSNGINNFSSLRRET